MDLNYLSFEQPIAELKEKIESLRNSVDTQGVSIAQEIDKLEKKAGVLTKTIYSRLSPWQTVQVARHPNRPHALAYIEGVFDNFIELGGDRHYGNDQALITGIARLDGRPVAVIAQEKGNDVEERVKHNFAMPRPEGYRKALRIMKLAEAHHLPVLTFIDTPGAYPGVGAEERGQSEAIAFNLEQMSSLRTPIIATIIGEGGSGGALAIGVCDKMLMLQYSIYSVISPEGCAAILWKSPSKTQEAADAMRITAPDLLKFKLIDEIIKEPAGGAHRMPDAMVKSLKSALKSSLQTFKNTPTEKLIERRWQRLKSYSALPQS